MSSYWQIKINLNGMNGVELDGKIDAVQATAHAAQGFPVSERAERDLRARAPRRVRVHMHVYTRVYISAYARAHAAARPRIPLIPLIPLIPRIY